MTYLERVSTTPATDLITAEVPGIQSALGTTHTQYACATVTYKQADMNRAIVDQAMEELRRIWRLANSQDPAWRSALAEFATRKDIGRVATVRLGLIAERAA